MAHERIITIDAGFVLRGVHRPRSLGFAGPNRNSGLSACYMNALPVLAKAVIFGLCAAGVVYSLATILATVVYLVAGP